MTLYLSVTSIHNLLFEHTCEHKAYFESLDLKLRKSLKRRLHIDQNSVLGAYSTCLSGRGTNMSRSTLPGLSSASSIMSGRFVATTSKTSLLSTDFVSVLN